VTPSPIIFICYNRPEHTLQSLTAAINAAADCSPDNVINRNIFVFQDGEKQGSADDNHKKTRELIRNLRDAYPGVIHYHLHEGNIGLRKNITSSISKILGHVDSAIILEDDIVINTCCLSWLDNAIELYKKDERVGSIQAYVPPKSIQGDQGVFFLGADSWGWATWSRAWRLYDDDLPSLHERLRKHPLYREFNNGSQANWNGTLRLSLKNKRNSWAVRWRASLFIHDKVSLYPSHPLIVNCGHDGTGEHCTISNTYNSQLSNKKPTFPPTVEHDHIQKRNLNNWHRTHNSIPLRVWRRLRTTAIKAFRRR
jgi:hypothetical protein